MHKTRSFVVARYLEPVEWVDRYDEEHISIVHKNLDIPNIGRESSSWLLWILNNYCELPDYVTFLQGNPFDHSNEKDIFDIVDTGYTRHGKLLECRPDGNPHHGGLDVSTPLIIMGVTPPGNIPFCMGAQFTASRSRLLRYTYQQYADLFRYSVTAINAPWELERCWEILFRD